MCTPHGEADTMLPNGCRRLSSSIRCPPSSGTRSCQPSGANTRAVPCSDTTVTASPTAAKSDLKSRHESPSRQTTSPEEPTSPGSHTPVTPSPPPQDKSGAIFSDSGSIRPQGEQQGLCAARVFNPGRASQCESGLCVERAWPRRHEGHRWCQTFRTPCADTNR